MKPAQLERMQVMNITAQHNAAAIAARQPAFRPGHMPTQLYRILNARLLPHEALARIWQLVDDVFASVGENAACRRGCSHCCHIPVAVTTVEAELIGQRIGRKPRTVPGRQRFDDVPSGYDHPCTFLVDGACSIYAHRPLACRVYFNLDVDALMCELTPQDPQSAPVPQFNTHAYQLAAVTASGGPSTHNRLGDIREFFPPADKA